MSRSKPETRFFLAKCRSLWIARFVLLHGHRYPTIKWSIVTNRADNSALSLQMKIDLPVSYFISDSLVSCPCSAEYTVVCRSLTGHQPHYTTTTHYEHGQSHDCTTSYNRLITSCFCPSKIIGFRCFNRTVTMTFPRCTRKSCTKFNQNPTSAKNQSRRVIWT